SSSAGVVDAPRASRVGGLIGSADPNGDVRYVHSSANVVGQTRVGGLIGWNSALVQDAYSTGSVTGVGVSNTEATGGLVGENVGVLSRTFSSGDVSGTGGVNGYHGVGGLVGINTTN